MGREGEGSGERGGGKRGERGREEGRERGREARREGEGSRDRGGGKRGERGREAGIGYPPVHPHIIVKVKECNDQEPGQSKLKSHPKILTGKNKLTISY